MYKISGTLAGLSAEDVLTGSNLSELIDSSTDLHTDGIQSIALEERLTPGPDDFEWKWVPEQSCLHDSGTWRLTLSFKEHISSPTRKLFRFLRTEGEA